LYFRGICDKIGRILTFKGKDMSRIGKQPIAVPTGVTITVGDKEITVAGPKGSLNVPVQANTKTKVEDGKIIVTRDNDLPESRAWHGLQRALLNNAVEGVTKGFEKKLEINGVGFRLSGGGQQIEMALGFSHPVKYTAPEGVQLTTNKMEITVSGVDKQKVGQVAAEIRALKKPEPYKGKGIKYVDEVILRKAGKAGKK
jgi:large subunit ribosomal protein L6